MRSEMAFLGVALVWGLGVAIAGDAAGWDPLVAPLSSVVVIAAFGWLRRGRDVVDVFAQGIGISYAAFLGLALARVTQPNMIAADWWLEPLNARWPVVLLAGLAYALILTVFVAIPIALIPVRPHLDTERNARFLAFLHDLANRDDATTLANHAKRIGIDFEGAELNPDIASWRAAGTEERRSRSGAQPLCGDGAAGGAGG